MVLLAPCTATVGSALDESSARQRVLAGHAETVPLVVDLDDTLLQTDSMIESVFVLARRHPLRVLQLPFWLAGGRAAFKQHLASVAMPEVESLPFHAEILQFLREQKRAGRKLVLATGADERLASAIVRELDLFDAVFGSASSINLTGKHKRERLVAEYGLRGFDYIGNGPRDIAVWSAARRALMVSPSRGLTRAVMATTPIERTFEGYRRHWADHLDALRPLHWTKNSLVFLPLFAAHALLDLERLANACLAFVAFCLCASSIYLLNDLFDLAADRRHPHKKDRKIAGGSIRLMDALVLMLALAVGAVVIGWQLPHGVLLALCAYYVSMLAYSVRLKEIPILDVMLLAGGYALRVLAGALATGVELSAWLLVWCMAIFSSLALVKRYAELTIMESVAGSDRARGYLRQDRPVILAEGVASGYLSVLVLALYTYTELSHQGHSHPQWFWILCVQLLHWISYVWLMAGRGQMHHDPVLFALRDRGSRWQVIAMSVVAVLAL